VVILGHPKKRRNEMSHDQSPRIILALATEADDQHATWNQLKTIQTEMFAAGSIAVKYCYFGREGAGQTSRPYISTRWATDADDLADLMDHARANCVCGCFVDINSILDAALRETKQGAVQAVVIVGDSFFGNRNAAVAIAKQLRAAGTKVFLFQQGNDRNTADAFQAVAEITGGAHVQFNPHVERVAKRLPAMLDAVTQFAIGGTSALKALDAVLLLEQMNENPK
jgi:hypothetical protein